MSWTTVRRMITAHHNAWTETKEEIDQYNDAVLHCTGMPLISLNERIEAFKQRNAARNRSISKLKALTKTS